MWHHCEVSRINHAYPYNDVHICVSCVSGIVFFVVRAVPVAVWWCVSFMMRPEWRVSFRASRASAESRAYGTRYHMRTLHMRARNLLNREREINL